MKLPSLRERIIVISARPPLLGKGDKLERPQQEIFREKGKNFPELIKNGVRPLRSQLPARLSEFYSWRACVICRLSLHPQLLVEATDILAKPTAKGK